MSLYSIVAKRSQRGISSNPSCILPHSRPQNHEIKIASTPSQTIKTDVATNHSDISYTTLIGRTPLALRWFLRKRDTMTLLSVPQNFTANFLPRWVGSRYLLRHNSTKERPFQDEVVMSDNGVVWITLPKSRKSQVSIAEGTANWDSTCASTQISHSPVLDVGRWNASDFLIEARIPYPSFCRQ